ncbi:winged helix-turn-helix domain-containing protein [Pseudonocardia lacus]|uniref:winged helix-turn-helix domain-containing protein n=1 Tax=Pseudonocardia lacus TaxID=2835865 RepID=UPI001BDD69B7|nr:winged helix-turn-helix domain-containing protein [Pseudonocardia lacus]
MAHPGASLMSVIADAFGGRPQGVPEPWRERVLRGAPVESTRVLSPLFGPGSVLVPDCLTLTASLTTTDVGRQLEQLRDLSADVLVGQLEADFGGLLPPVWRQVVERPRRFVVAYARVLEAAWRAFAPIWAAAAELRDRDSARVDAAAGDLSALLGGLRGRLRVDGDAIRLPDPHPEVFDRGDRGLVLVPLVSGPSASIFSVDRPDVVWLGYPLPGLASLAGGAPAPRAADALELVLGAMRARILLTVDGGPAGPVARRTGCSPSTLSYHCSGLEAAGLIHRERSGQQVLLRRTARGDALIALFAR